MNRRTILKYGLLSGAAVPAALGQEPASRGSSKFEDEQDPPRRGATRAKPGSSDDNLTFPDEVDPKQGPAGTDIDVPPSNFREEAGHAWRSFDISRYTGQAYSPENPKPQNALVEWIFRTTGSSTWHGEKIAVLSAGRAQLRAYHNARVLGMVEETVSRFTKATADILNVRVRLVVTQDTRWRYTVFNRLKRIGSGPQGQQIWTLDPSDANYIHSQMMIYRGYSLLADQSVRMLNGQTFTLDHSDKVNYVAATQSDGASELGQQPRVEPLKEGVTLRLSPLLTYEGDALDAAIDLKATTVKRLVNTKILARRSVGPTDMSIDVPEVLETRLNQTLPNWAVGQVLVISAGILPGILRAKSGPLNLPIPGTVPTDTELIAIIEVEPSRQNSRSAKRKSAVDADEDLGDDEPTFRSARESDDDRVSRRETSRDDLER